MGKVVVAKTTCCTMKDVDGLSKAETPEDAMADLYEGFSKLQPHLPQFVLISAVTNRQRGDHTGINRADNYGQTFINYLNRENLLIASVETIERQNTITTNNVKVWVLTFDWPKALSKMKECYDKKYKKAQEEALKRQQEYERQLREDRDFWATLGAMTRPGEVIPTEPRGFRTYVLQDEERTVVGGTIGDITRNEGTPAWRGDRP